VEVMEFEWDDANLAHIAEHGVNREEAEHVIQNRPVDLSSQLRNGEQRTAQIGETNTGRVLVVISTMSGGRVRIVTAWQANRNYRRYFASLKRNGNVGKVERQDVRE
jgi:uncharacterized DUF497 family protein